MLVRHLPALLALASLLLAAPAAHAERKASHDGWPQITGVLLINKLNQSRPLDARVGADPFGGADPDYSCDGDHVSQHCFVHAGACAQSRRHTYLCAHAPVIPARRMHNELLGGHGSDTIYGGPHGDVLWADFWPSGQPAGQRDRIFGGPGSDFIYASHGYNEIHTGGGTHDIVHARYGRGDIYCDSPTAIANLSKRSKKRYTLHGCHRVTLRPVGTKEY